MSNAGMKFGDARYSAFNDPGPQYPALGAGVQKWRRSAAAAGGVMKMDPWARAAYGQAVEDAIKALQRSEIRRETPEHRPNCASGTIHNTGEAIHEAVRAKQRAALAAAPGKERRARKPETWKSMYREAMAERRAREAAPPEPKRVKRPKAKARPGQNQLAL